MALIWSCWWYALHVPLSRNLNLLTIVGGVLLAFPAAWIGRKMLDLHRTIAQAAWITTFVHCALGLFLAIPLIRAIATHEDWLGATIPPAIGLALVVVSGMAFLLVVANLALKGLGAPFFIALSRKLAADWMYAWTRNPMVLAGLALLLSLGIWFRSAFFLLWTLALFAPALLFFVKVFEERELEIRFGASYLAYKSRTPMLFPRRPRH